MLADMETMTYVTEVRLAGGRGFWNVAAPSSCPEVDLEVIEEYLQEHSLEVQPAHGCTSRLTAEMQHADSHHGTGIPGLDNNWCGQYAEEWHCGGNTEYDPTWLCSHPNQWNNGTYSKCIDLDSQCQEYHDAASPSSSSENRPNKDLLLAPMSGTIYDHFAKKNHRNLSVVISSFAGKRKERLFQFLFEMLQTPLMRSCIWWVQSSSGTFQFSSQNKEHLAEIWGRRKGNRKTMTYQKMARALRNYSRTGEIQKVKRKLTYRFDEKTLRGLQGDSNAM
uniref:transcription factor PU.1-like isoform X1 n=1 Tax=Doryrhamphus excisus TaxID=161450 RepID=UPI0025AE2C30|nr:transcription factor PU.1-like isoform X1 [Doryrhamphus excisus]XP_057939768.1 transcription factor PU.1-like isoform X1 [Doryrhamphus excisus]XP_057939769.1 transcription factor PU.1-like isoform X1 [Doryrhamphus excisus]XP_057939770.1 transcription factor PU.1-like isoform X1 [Doryrhamphus excisus]XP_057939771.1 transcription factor PU.1-like isoform X1 [Doryrhamphus excisus]